MEPNTQPQSGIAPTKVSSHRTFVFSLLIIAAVVVAGIVILAANRDLMVSEPNVQGMYSAPSEEEGADTVAENLRVQGSSNNLSDIEADLNATNVDSITE